jgi:hypothetical protein
MLYNLSNPLDRERFAARANALLQKGSVTDLTEKTLRTHNQNSYLHLIIGAVAMDVGVTLEYAKREYFKKLVNRDLFIRKEQDRFSGEIEVIRSSADLTIEEMSIALIDSEDGEQRMVSIFQVRKTRTCSSTLRLKLGE